MLNEMLEVKGKPFNIRKASTDNWYSIAIGTSEAHINITLVNYKGVIGIELLINDNKRLFDDLFSQKQEIENILGFILDWQRLDGKKASRIIVEINGLSFDDHSNYNELMEESIEKAVKMRDVLSKYVKQALTNGSADVS